jgi:hypothetical protein
VSLSKLFGLKVRLSPKGIAHKAESVSRLYPPFGFWVKDGDVGFQGRLNTLKFYFFGACPAWFTVLGCLASPLG